MIATSKQHVVSEDYRPPVHFALALQIPTAVLCFLMLDGGHLAKLCGIAMSAHWVWILWAMIRRPHSPTKMDLKLIRWGFLLIFIPLLFVYGMP